ncbi:MULTISPECIES: DUF1304 domain-containing protein [unclassified Isoptericola]|uniref:DUF1304 domain-containing protein n=1 Tax=unclassified Isoptericola TaxID=2623355 RepID=UPI0027141E16|nr:MULTISPECIES: DUF1304 domain-containing protein [unclassified Isoptericola]MDO8145847.1 DUF1304 domain-containing protein [Isoptericola sp. 178]MDO8149922.1 DUF1304 domain-containing protein [Isoptericola sp. b408]
MIVTGLVLTGLAAALHVYIFWLESFAWTTRARAVFGTTADQAAATRELAFNQGFYNLFLAIIAVTGIVLTLLTGASDDPSPAGASLLLAGTGAMTAAALVLLVSSPDKRRAAVTQGTLPLLAVVAVTAALLS